MIERILSSYKLDEDFGERFPTSFVPTLDKYIVLQTGSEMKSQVFDYLGESVQLIFDLLIQQGYGIIQFGDKEDPSVPSSLDLRGQLSIWQVAHVVKYSQLCVSSNKFLLRLCRIFDKDVIFLGSNFPSKSVIAHNPKATYIEPEIPNKWNYKSIEDKKTINLIKPETISTEILRKLNIPFQEGFKTLFIGDKYNNKIVDFVPNCPFPQELTDRNINVRLDLEFNVDFTSELSKYVKIFITTNKSFELKHLNRKNVLTITYFCEDEVDIPFVKECIKRNIKVYVISTKEESLADLRLALLGICEVYRKMEQKPLDFLESGSTMVKTNRLYFGLGQVFPSLFHYKKGMPDNPNGSFVTEEMINDQDFLESKDSMYFFKAS